MRYKVDADFRTLGGYFTRLETNSRPAINLGILRRRRRASRPTLSAISSGCRHRRSELDQMKALVGEAMRQGALGISTSLQYVPDRFASTEEIVELARVAAEHGGRYLDAPARRNRTRSSIR